RPCNGLKSSCSETTGMILRRWDGRSRARPCASRPAIIASSRAVLPYDRTIMTPAERNIVKSLIAVAWADGQMEESEASVVEGLLVGFDASDEEEREMLQWAKTPRSLDKDIPLDELDEEDRELLLAN